MFSNKLSKVYIFPIFRVLRQIRMASISMCFGSNLYVIPSIVACRSTSASHATFSGSGSSTDYYKLLSLSSNKAGTQEIKRAYRTLALKYHPDVSHDHDTAKMFVLLYTAYKTLVDPVSREEYDCALMCCETGYGFGDHVGDGKRWKDQIFQLKKRSSYHVERKEGSWGSRVRYGNRQNEES